MDFVLLHGTAQSPAGWARLIDVLEGRGHRAIAVDFPTDRPELLADDYARIAVTQLDDVHEPVVVAHSAACLLLPAVGAAVKASHLVYLAGPVPDFACGSSFVDQITRSGSEIADDEWRSIDPESVEDPLVAAYFAFHDGDWRTVRWAATTMRLFYPKAVYAEAAPSAPRTASTAVVPRHDRMLRPEWMARVARERLGVEQIEVDGGHFPHVSRPQELAAILISG